MRLRLLTLLVLCCGSSLALAAKKEASTERVVAVKPDGSVMLVSSGNAVFANLFFPDVKRAERWLAETILQQEISFSKGEEDRYGRLQITSDIAQRMLRDGVAIYYESEDKIAADWKAAEAAARQAKRGVWGEKEFIATPENAAQQIGKFHVVEGTITRVYEAKKATYLNFGEDWHSDFSITIPAKLRRSMKAQLPQLKPGTTIRVRGFVHDENGPMVTLMKPGNLELR
jgi:hypothetical protein